MITVKELKERLLEFPEEWDDREVVIYPKYSACKVDGYLKHSFRVDQVCLQFPTPPDEEGLESYRYNKHVAIMF